MSVLVISLVLVAAVTMSRSSRICTSVTAVVPLLFVRGRTLSFSSNVTHRRALSNMPSWKARRGHRVNWGHG